MIKRGIIQLAGAEPKIRISRPGVDVDFAGEADFILHENYAAAQPYFFTYVACPFSGSGGATSARVPVTAPDVGETDPVVVIYSRIDSDFNCFPTKRRSQGRTGGGSAYHFHVGYRVISPTSFEVVFNRQPNSGTSPTGAYFILYRRGL